MYVKVISCTEKDLENQINNWLAELDSDPIIQTTNLSTRKYGQCTYVIFYTLRPLK